MSKLFLVLFILSFNGFAQETQTRIIPDPDTYQEFLLSKWDSQKPVLITFKDPRCPYCIKALKKIERLDNYNVFLFWAPILGERSVTAVDAFFTCGSPTGEEVMRAAKKRVMPACSGQKNVELDNLNNTMITNYDPRSVPQYWLGGRRVNVSQLRLAQSLSDRIDDVIAQKSVVIPWNRYSEMAVTPAKRGLNNIALVLPGKKKAGLLLKNAVLIDGHFRWYIVDEENIKSATEFRLLTNLVDAEQPMFVLEGKLLNEKEIYSLLPDDVLRHLAL